jgi:hypothetical protein
MVPKEIECSRGELDRCVDPHPVEHEAYGARLIDRGRGHLLRRHSMGSGIPDGVDDRTARHHSGDLPFVPCAAPLVRKILGGSNDSVLDLCGQFSVQ